MLSTVGIFIYTTYWGLLYGEHCGNIYLHKILRNTVCWALWEDLFTQNTKEYCTLSTVGRFIYTKYWGILYVEHCEKIYLHKILRNTLCWALWEDLFTQNTEEYCMLSTVRRFIYTKYWGLLLVEHCGNIYLHKILGNTLCWTLGKFIYTKYWGLLYVEHCGKIYLHKILRNTLCWTLWEDLFTQNTEEKCMFEHCGKIYLHKILRNALCWTLWEDLFTQNTEEYCMLSTVGRFIYTKYWGIYCMLSTVRRFIYTRYWGILYVEHCGKIYLLKILRNTLCWTLWEDLFTQNTEEYCMLSTVRRFIYTNYWGILYVEHCDKIYLHKILGITLCWTLWEDVFTQNTEEYCMLSTMERFI
jgi:hypothetical protein